MSALSSCLADKISPALEARKDVWLLVALDFKGAFDKVLWWRGLLAAHLWAVGVRSVQGLQADAELLVRLLGPLCSSKRWQLQPFFEHQVWSAAGGHLIASPLF